jgi:hypothetical protein
MIKSLVQTTVHDCRAARLQPKHPSPALLVEALGKDGAPVWMARDVIDLVNTCRSRGISGNDGDNSSGNGGSNGGRGGSFKRAQSGRSRRPGAVAAAADRASPDDEEEGGLEEEREPPWRRQQLQRHQNGGSGNPRGGGRLAGASSGRPLGEGQERGRYSRQQLEEVEEERAEGAEEEREQEPAGEVEDIDRLLVIAAAEVEAQDRGRSKNKPGKQQQQRRPGKPSEAAGGGFDRRMLERLDGSFEGESGSGSSASAGDDEASPAASPSPRPACARRGGSALRNGSRGAAGAGGLDAGEEEGGARRLRGAAEAIVLEDREAVFLLVATERFLRLYTSDGAARGARRAARKVELAGRLRFASAFAAGGGAALVCLLERGGEDRIQVRASQAQGLLTTHCVPHHPI